MPSSSARRNSIGAGRGAYRPCRQAWLLLSSALAVAAGPTPTRRNLGTDTSQPDSGSANNSILQTWIPVALVAVLVIVVIAVTMSKRGRTWIARLRGQPVPVETPTPAPAAARSVRPRRRRRASQISTKSLPAYMEEPGDEELVLVRRTMAAEARMQEDMSGTSGMSGSPSEDTHGDDTHAETTTMSDAPSYTGPATVEPAHLRSLSIGESIGIHSTDTAHMGSDESTTSLMRLDRRASVRSAAPSYRDVVSAEEASRISMDLQRIQSATGSSPGEGEPTPAATPAAVQQDANATQRPGNERRRSGFFGLFAHNRQTSAASALEAGTTSPRQSMARPSGEGDHPSWFNLNRLSHSGPSPLTPPTTAVPANPSATNSRTHLTSPSLTSFHSAVISPPLTQTATRVSFDFPRSGPTPQQIAFLASRETLERFGLPFGENAQAAAAAQAETSSLPPPPSFEEGDSGSGDDARSTRTTRTVATTAEAAANGEESHSPEMGGMPVPPVEDTTNQGTIRARPQSHPTLDTAAIAAAVQGALTPPVKEVDTRQAEVPPNAELPTPVRPKVPLSIPVATSPMDESLPALSIIPATPLSSLPPTPAAANPPTQILTSARE